MGLLGGLFGRRSDDKPPLAKEIKAEELSADACLGDPTIHVWHEALLAGDVQKLRAYLATETDLDRRDAVLLAVLDATPANKEWILEWVREEPQSSVAHLARGRDLTDWAWEARSHARAKDVSRDQFNVFFERLRVAWEELEIAGALAPDDGSIPAMQITTAMGLQMGEKRGADLYNAAQLRRPWQPAAHWFMLQYVAPKWSRSPETMWSFARSATEGAPIGSPVHGVIPGAHVETWIELEGAEQSAYWERPEVKAEINAAAAKSIEAAPADQSSLMTAARLRFAYCFARVGERAKARREFELIGPYIGGPFMYSGNPRHMGAAFRNWANGVRM